MIVAIIDLAHHGTTMLAGVLEILGIPMVGERYKPHKWEDLEVIEALGDPAAFGQLVRQRAGKPWGFKRPGAWQFMESLHCLDDHDPVYLAIYKDPVSVTRRRFGRATLSKLLDTMQQMERSVTGIKASGLSVVTFSYQKAIVDPLGFVREVIEATGIHPMLEQAIKAADYIQPNHAGPRARYPDVAEYLS